MRSSTANKAARSKRVPLWRMIRDESRRRGLDWDVVWDVYCELRVMEIAKRERVNEVREAAWMMATASRPNAWPFWRHGFVSRWGRQVDLHDYTAIPGYDEIHQAIATQFPEYAGPDGTERLFDLLLSPYDRLPTADQLYRRAMDHLEARKPEPVPF